jgi:riboflavin kinase
MAQPKNLPFFAKGYVIKGFGRGSKELGIPTGSILSVDSYPDSKLIILVFFILANLPDEVIETLPSEIDTGIYYGLASVNGGTVHKMVMSIGWNPFYKNIKKSMVSWLKLFIYKLNCNNIFL